MTLKKLKLAESEARRFLLRAKEYRERLGAERIVKYGCKEGSALRRASMDLTRALAQLRKARD